MGVGGVAIGKVGAGRRLLEADGICFSFQVQPGPEVEILARHALESSRSDLLCSSTIDILGWSVHCRMFSSVSGLCPLNSSFTFMVTKNVSRFYQMSQGGAAELIPVESHCSRVLDAPTNFNLLAPAPLVLSVYLACRWVNTCLLVVPLFNCCLGSSPSW